MSICITAGRNVSITRNVFLNAAGHNCIALNMRLGQPHQKALIIENVSLNGGHSTGTEVENKHNNDFSFCYSEWDSTVFADNRIEQQYPDIALRGYTGGIEIHGSHSSAVRNIIVGCKPAIYVASTLPFYAKGAVPD